VPPVRAIHLRSLAALYHTRGGNNRRAHAITPGRRRGAGALLRQPTLLESDPLSLGREEKSPASIIASIETVRYQARSKPVVANIPKQRAKRSCSRTAADALPAP
jgi:hypothetical protein